MSFWASVLTIFTACAFGANLFASDSKVSSKPSGLNIDRLDLPDGTQCTLDPVGQPQAFVIRIVLSNPTDLPISIWVPERNEGSKCPELVFTSATGEQTTLVAADFPQMGPPFSTPIKPHSTYSIQRDLSKLTSDHPLVPGKYSLKIIYHNETDAIGPVRNVWTGSIASKDYNIEIVGPK